MKTPLYFAGLALLLILAACASPYAPKRPRPAPEAPQPTGYAPPVVSGQRQIVSRGVIPERAKPLKVALLVPLSGDSMAVGNAMFDAASMALYDGYLTVPSDQIHSKIVLLPKDTGNTPAQAVKAAESAVAQGADFVIGPLFSQAVSAVAPVTAAAKIDMLTFSNNRAVAKNNVFVFGFSPEQQVDRMAEFAFLKNYTRVALLAPNDPYGQKVKDRLFETYFKKGGMVSPRELYAPSYSNIEAAVSRLALAYTTMPEERRFQAIFIADGGAQLKNIVKALKKSTIDLSKVKLLGTGLWDDQEITQIEELRGAWFPSSPPGIYKDFERRFTATYGYKPVRLASLAYDAVSLVAQLSLANEQGVVTSAALTNPEGYLSPANGMFRLLPDGASDRKLDVMEVTSGGFKVIDIAPRTFNVTAAPPSDELKAAVPSK